MLQAYFDESYSEVGRKCVYMAGYVTYASTWAEFSDVWDQQCKASPRIDYLHMVEAQNLRDQFKGWRPDDRDRKVLALASVVRHFRPWAISCSVSREDYSELVTPYAPFQMKSPYFACFYGIVLGLARLQSRLGNPIPLDLIFDEQASQWDVLMAYDFVKAEQRPDIAAAMGSAPIFRNDKQILPLQAADMLAWHLRRDAEGTADAQHQKTLHVLREGCVNVRWDMTAEEIAPMGARMKTLDISGIQTRQQWRAFKREFSEMKEAGVDPMSMHTEPRRGFVRDVLFRLFRGRAE
jgi:hypothetical protein